LNTSGEAVLRVEKERFEMIDGAREITMGELEKAWCKIKRGKLSRWMNLVCVWRISEVL
jgi:hypothetical protein